MRRLAPVLLVGLLLGADDSALAKKDLERMQGDWNAVTFVADGKAADAAELAKIKLSVKGDTVTYQHGDHVGKSTYKLDPSQTPKALDIVVLEGPNKGKMILGIYEFDGDKLRIALRGLGKERPKNFTDRAGQTLEEWQRMK